MSLLELDHVSKRYGSGAQERIALRDVSLQFEEGELVAVRGRRRSGRSTLLRVASGIETPDSGTVRSEGHSLGERGSRAWNHICYCRKTFRRSDGQLVLDQLLMGQLTRGVSLSQARARAREALQRAGAELCATLRPRELDGAEAVRVVIARALLRQPKLLVIDEPTIGVDVLARDEVLALLRSLADEGIAVLASAGDVTGLTGADRALSLEKGELHGTLIPERGSVVPLRLAGGKVSGRVKELRSASSPE